MRPRRQRRHHRPSRGHLVIDERRLLSGLVHDLTSPLNKVVAFARLLEEDAGELSGEAREDLDHLVQSASEAREWLARLGAWNHADRVGELIDVDLASIVATTEAQSAGDFPVVRADAEGVKRVLNELLRNAEVHGAPPILVRATPTGFQVEDGGDGIEDVESACEPLSRRHVHHGTGFGLAIAKRTADAMGASLTLENGSPENGSSGLVARLEW